MKQALAVSGPTWLVTAERGKKNTCSRFMNGSMRVKTVAKIAPVSEVLLSS